MEDAILEEISKVYPCDIYEVRHVYDKIKSYDKTIMILDMSIKTTIPTYDIVEFLIVNTKDNPILDNE
jgi:hypothetical protein